MEMTLAEKLRPLSERCAAFSAEFASLLTSTAALLKVMEGPAPELEDRRRLVAAIRETVVVRLLPFCELPIVRTLKFAVTQLRDDLAVFKRESPRLLSDDELDPQVARFARAAQETQEQLDGLVEWFRIVKRALEDLDRARQKLKTLEAKQAVIEARVETVTAPLAELATAYGQRASTASTPEGRAHVQDLVNLVSVTRRVAARFIRLDPSFTDRQFQRLVPRPALAGHRTSAFPQPRLKAWYAALGEQHPKWSYDQKVKHMSETLGISRRSLKLDLRTSRSTPQTPPVRTTRKK
jgi:hypothetical protein